MTSKAPTTASPTVGVTPGPDWATTLNSIISNFSTAFGGNANISFSGVYTLSNTELQNAIITVTGLSAISTIVFPAGYTGTWVVINNSNYPLILNPIVNNEFIMIDPLSSDTVVSPDGASLYQASANVVPPGTIISYGGDSAVFGGFSAPGGYLLCSGQQVLQSNYPRLYRALDKLWTPTGSTPDDGYFFIPLLVGGAAPFLRGRNGIDPVGTYQADTFASHTHIDSGHSHAFTLPSPYSTFYLGSPGVPRPQYVPTGSGDIGLGFPTINNGQANIQPNGGAETRPKNFSVNYIIKY